MRIEGVTNYVVFLGLILAVLAGLAVLVSPWWLWGFAVLAGLPLAAGRVRRSAHARRNGHA